MAAVAEITPLTVDEFARDAQQFDHLADAVRTAAKLNDGTTPAALQTEVEALKALAQSGLGGLISESAEFTKDLNRLESRATEIGATKGHLLFDTVRLIARHVLDRAFANNDVADPAAKALAAFQGSVRLRASAMDILATAILMPRLRFVEACYGANHKPASIAAELGLPTGAAALRQRVLFPDKYKD